MEPTAQIPETLNAAMATEPAWLQAWIMLLVVSNLAALVFVARRDADGWGVRIEPIAIVLSFFAAGAAMGWLYDQVGYVRLLGLAHLVFWGPVWGWVLSKRRAIGTQSLYGKYIHLYLVVAGLSLVIDALDVVRYLLGDGELFLRWS